MREIENVSAWLESNGIKKDWAFKTAAQIKKEYPALGMAMKNQQSNRAELELVQLIDHVMKGRFPVKQSAIAAESPV